MVTKLSNSHPFPNPNWANDALFALKPMPTQEPEAEYQTYLDDQVSGNYNGVIRVLRDPSCKGETFGSAVTNYGDNTIGFYKGSIVWVSGSNFMIVKGTGSKGFVVTVTTTPKNIL